jgi:exonuclease III
VKTDSRRLWAIRLVSSDIKLLLVNVYMPYESDEDSTVEFFYQLLLIEGLIMSNLDCQFIIGGDFNVDFSRNLINTVALRSFCDDQSLTAADGFHNSSIDYTYNFNMTCFSTLDHFLVSCILFNSCLTSVSVIHDVNNLSDHEPIIMGLELAVVRSAIPRNIVNDRRKVSWDIANDSHIRNYRDVLCTRLN